MGKTIKHNHSDGGFKKIKTIQTPKPRKKILPTCWEVEDEDDDFAEYDYQKDNDN